MSEATIVAPAPVSDIEVPAATVHEQLTEKLASARLGGSEKNRKKITESGKLLVRERLAILFDDENYIEDGLLARYEEGLPGDAVVIAFGRVDGREVCVIANDYSVKAGTWGNRTFEKITQAQKNADAAGIPIVYLFDSAGARIDEQFESFAGRHAWGNIFYNQVQISGRVPQVCALFGPSPAGSAYVPALCDMTIMVRGHATAYLGSPRLAEMVTGEKVTLEEMGGAEMHCTVSGLGDVLVEDDEEALNAIRVWLSFLPANWENPRAAGPRHRAAPRTLSAGDRSAARGRGLRHGGIRGIPRGRRILVPVQGTVRSRDADRLRPHQRPAGGAGGQPAQAHGRCPSSPTPRTRLPASSGSAMPTTSPSSSWWTSRDT